MAARLKCDACTSNFAADGPSAVKHNTRWQDGDECPDCGGRLGVIAERLKCDDCGLEIEEGANEQVGAVMDGDECPNCGGRLEEED